MIRNRTFKFLSWNVRGLNNRAKCTGIKNFIKGCRCAVVCLQETKLSSLSEAKFRSFCGFHLSNFRALDALGTRGGLVTAWNPALFICDDYWVGTFSLNLVLRRRVDDRVFSISNIYGPIEPALKDGFLREIRSIASKVVGV